MTEISCTTLAGYSGAKGIGEKLVLQVSEKSYDKAKNQSTVEWTAKIYYTNVSVRYTGTTRANAGSFSFVVNGKTVASGTHSLNNGAFYDGRKTYEDSGTVVVDHGSDGKGSCSFSISSSRGGGNYQDDPYVYYGASKKGSIDLTTIKRFATIDSFNVGNNIGETFNVKFTTYVKDYSYKLRLSIPGVIQIETKSYGTSGTNVSFSDDGIATIIKNVKSGASTVSIGAVIETYSGTTKIGESSELKKDMNLAKAPSIGSISYHRTSSKGEADDGGNYVLCEFGYSADYLNGKNTATAKIEYKRIADQTWQTAVSRSFTEDGRISALFEADGDYTYEIRLTVQDRFTTVTQKRSVAGFETIFDFKWNSDADGFAWGKSAEFKQQFDIPEGWVYSIGGVPIGLSGADTSGFNALQSRIKQLEDTVAQLQKQINNK